MPQARTAPIEAVYRGGRDPAARCRSTAINTSSRVDNALEVLVRKDRWAHTAQPVTCVRISGVTPAGEVPSASRS